MRATDSENKIGNHFAAARRVRHLRVEQHAKNLARPVSYRRDGVAAAAGDYLEFIGDVINMVAVTHPCGDLFVRRESEEQLVALSLNHIQLSTPILAATGTCTAAAEVRDEHHAVANAEYWRDVE